MLKKVKLNSSMKTTRPYRTNTHTHTHTHTHTNVLSFPSPGDLPNPGIEPGSTCIAGRCFNLWATREAPFIIGDWKAKVQSQGIPGVKGKFGLGVKNEAGQMLTEFCQENALAIANTLFQQHKRRRYTWTSPDSQYQNQIDYILCNKDGEALYISKNKTGSCLWLRS